MDKAVEDIFGAALSADTKSEVANENATPDSTLFGEEVLTDKVNPKPMTALAGFVMRNFRINASHRRECGPDGLSVDMRLSDAMMAQTCKYTPNERLRLERSGIPSRVYVPITATKVRAAKSMLVDLINSGGEPLFTMAPTPDPDVPEEVQLEAMKSIAAEIQAIFQQLESSGVQEIPPPVFAKLQELIRAEMIGRYDTISNKKESYARIRAKRMEKKVWDMMVEGGWDEAFADYINNICIYGTGIIVGPIVRNVAKNKCVREGEGENAVRKYKRVVKQIPCFESLNPYDCYPSPDAKKVEDGVLCVRVKYTANELWRFSSGAANVSSDKKGGEGWNDSAVNLLLSMHPNGGVHLSEEQRNPDIRGAENGATENVSDCTFEGVRCFASVRGHMLAEMGIVKNRDGKKVRLNDFYYTETIVIDNIVVFCRIYDDRLGVPLSKGVFYELPGSWWGESVADKLICVQYTMNVCIKSLLRNMGVASGPMYWMSDVSRLTDKSPDGLKMFPHKIWGFTSSIVGASGAPMGVLSVPSNATELMNVFNQMKTQADDDSGIPAYTYGQSSGQGALRTASGLAIFSEAASRGMKMVITTTDRLVVADVARRCADWVLIYDDDMDLKGDVEVKPVGLMGKILKAQQDQQRLTVFQMVTTNQFLLQAIGIKGVFELFRPTIHDLNINPDNVIPSEERMKIMETIAEIKQIFEATAAANGVQENAAPQQGGGVPGVERPQAMQGGVEQRRSVA